MRPSRPSKPAKSGQSSTNSAICSCRSSFRRKSFQNEDSSTLPTWPGPSTANCSIVIPMFLRRKRTPPPLSPAEVSQQWDRLKQLERSAHADSVQHPLGVIPGRLPALQRAQKLIARARRKGIPLPVMPAAAAQHRPDCEEELGRQLFALAADAEKLGVDAESALRRTVHRVLAETHSQGSTPVESTVDF